MDVYTLTPQFFPNVNIDRFFSLIWTERYYDAGDFQLVVPVTPALVSQLAPGTFVALRGLQEIMVVDTLSIDSNSMTVTGSSLVKFLNQRLAWFEDPGYDGTGDSTDGSSSTTTSGNKYADFNTDIETAGQFISDVIVNMVIEPVPFDSPWLSINLDWANEVFPHLSLGHVDDNGDTKDLSFPIGPLFDGLVQVAQGQNIGFKLYLESTDYDTGDHSLKFATYRGKDRTTDQDTFDLVRFSPNLDNFTGVKEIITNMDFKNVAYVTFENKVTVHYPDWVDPDSPPLDWRRRVIRVDAPSIHLNPGDDRIENFRARVAADTFRHQRGSRSIDGQVLAIDHTYSFPDDYYLGDLVELEGQTGIVKARVIEYIRSQNQYGQTEYPTFDVLHPLDTSFIGDPIFHPPWNDNPVTTGDPPDTIPDLTDVPLTPTTPFEVSGWVYDTDIGYYIHSGRFYIVGTASIDGFTAGAVPDTLFDNIPSKFLPESPVHCKVLIDHRNSTFEYAYDSGLEIGPWLDVTVNLNGSITLDEPNPYIEHPDDGSYLDLILSTISWPTSIAQTDRPSDSGSLDEFVSTTENIAATDTYAGYTGDDGWVNVDGGYAIHGGRLHLHGSVKAGPVGANWAPLLGMPSDIWPKLTPEPTSLDFCEVPTSSAYRTIAYTYNGILDQIGCQNPQAVGNNGCGWWKNVYYSQYHTIPTGTPLEIGFLARGTSPTLPSFTPGTADAGLDFIGASGYPITTLPDSARWSGNDYTVWYRYRDLDVPNVTDDTDAISVLTGSSQFCFIMGIIDDMEAYYKVSLGYDTTLQMFGTYLFYVPCGGDQSLLASYHWANSHPEEHPYISSLFRARFSTVYGDVGFTTDPGSGGTYWALMPPNVMSNHGTTATYEAATGAISPGAVGHMGIHFPSGTNCAIDYSEIDGTGDFPNIVEDDVLNFDGCGWPLK